MHAARARDGAATGACAPPVSVIVPTLNEAARIGRCLASLDPIRDAGGEVIVADGGSRDQTVAVATGAGAQVVRGARGRARQMNQGAARARGRLLAFLHADTTPGPHACQRLLALAGSGDEVWGRFDVLLSGPGAALRLIGLMMNLRSRWTGIATGDQLIFVSRALFERVGGFPEVALMEDIRLSAALRRVLPPVCARERVETSSRKWREEGVVRTVLLMWWTRLAHALGADPAKLARRYYGPS